MEAWAMVPTAAVPMEDMVLVLDMAVLALAQLELALELDMAVVVVTVVARAMAGIIPTEGARFLSFLACPTRQADWFPP